jgi:DNA modification methylase
LSSPNTYIRKSNGTNKNVHSKNMGEIEGTESLNSGDKSGSSKILHKIPYLNDPDLAIYATKVSPKERNAGLDAFEDKKTANLPMRSKDKDSSQTANDGTKTHRNTVSKNTHPTLKSIILIEKIATLLKTPNPQSVFFPFAGAGSEIIGFIKAGFDENLIQATEINPEYIDIAEARIKYWKNVDFDEYKETKELKETKKTKEIKELDEW